MGGAFIKRLIPIVFALFLVGCSDPNYISYVQDNYSVGEVYDEKVNGDGSL